MPSAQVKAPSRLQGLLGREPDITRLTIMLIVVYAAMALLRPGIFLTKDYTISILYLFPEYGVLSLAMMLALISGGIDLSIVAVADLAGIASCKLLVAAMPEDASLPVATLVLLVAVLFAVLIGAICGALSSTLIAIIGIPPMLATLGSADLILGLAVAITKGSSVKNLPPILSDVVNTNLLGVIPVTTVVFAFCAILVSYLLTQSSYGFKLVMLGSNKVASRYAGLHNTKIVFQTYILSGILSSLSGVLMCARFNSARSDFGTSYTLQALLVCVLAGVNPKGGYGKVKGVVLAILILQILSSGFNMFPTISNFYRNLIWGLVLLLIMVYNHFSERHQAKKMAIKIK